VAGTGPFRLRSDLEGTICKGGDFTGRISQNETNALPSINNDVKSKGSIGMKSKEKNAAGGSQRSPDGEMAEDGQDALTKYFDGMGTATARIIVHRNIDDDQWEKYGLKDLKNTGRYYLAKIVEKDGKVIDEILVDKQSGTIQSLRGKISSSDLKR
jgi:hypothetical protein